MMCVSDSPQPFIISSQYNDMNNANALDNQSINSFNVSQSNNNADISDIYW